MGCLMGLWMTETQKGAPYTERALVKRGCMGEGLAQENALKLRDGFTRQAC